MKILLLSANTLIEPYPVYPLGLDYVAGALSPSHQVQILDLNHLPDNGDLKSAVQAFDPELIGISLRNVDNTDVDNPWGFMQAYEDLIRNIRRITSAPIVLGGSGFTIFPEQAMAKLRADFGVMGEGERLKPLADALSRGKDPTGLEGVITGPKLGEWPEPWPGEPVRLFNGRSPHVSFYLNNSGMLNLQTKRGCPFHCIYCTYPHIEGHRMRLFNPDELGQTAARLQAAGAKYLFITDSAFNADIAHSLAVAKALYDNAVTIPWGAFFAPTRFPSDYFQTLAKCGLHHVEFGTESLSDTVLKSYKKPFQSREVSIAHNLARAAGLNVAHYFLFGGPGETRETLNETLEKIEVLNKGVFFHFCGMRIYPNTALYNLALDQGQIDPEQDLTEPVYYECLDLDSRSIIRQIKSRARNRVNWVIGAGGPEMAAITSKMYRRGYTGPLWEYLCR